MAPRVLDVRHCPHCKEALDAPTPRVCPACGGSLQKRYLSLGCLSTAPLLLAVAVPIALARSRSCARIDGPGVNATAAPLPAPASRSEGVAIVDRRP